VTHLVCFPSEFSLPTFHERKETPAFAFSCLLGASTYFLFADLWHLFHHGKHRFPISYFAASSYLFFEVFWVVFVPIMITFSVIVVVVVLGFPLSRPFLLQSVFSGCSEEHFLLVFLVIFSYLAASSDLFLRFFGFDFVPTMMTFVFLLLF
jgi:hypothetical protein